ncbi:MAG: OsmC family protein [Chloroflexota bacterium]
MNEATSQVSVRWTKNLQFVGLDADKRSLVLDGLPKAGGEGTGFRPMQLLLIALAGCTAMDVASILRKQRQDLTALEVFVSGHRVKEHPRIIRSTDRYSFTSLFSEIMSRYSLARPSLRPV